MYTLVVRYLISSLAPMNFRFESLLKERRKVGYSDGLLWCLKREKLLRLEQCSWEFCTIQRYEKETKNYAL